MRRRVSRETPRISTASLPDIIFMLLFFFMVATTLRETTLKVKVIVPEATEQEKLEKKSMVSYIYIGRPLPHLQAQYGTAPRIQLNDVLADVSDIVLFVENERANLPDKLQPYMTISLRVDTGVRMGIVTDVKQELRKANALKVSYSTRQRTKPL